MKRKPEDEAQASNYNPYDMLVKSLGFEKKEARGGERLKTEDEKLVLLTCHKKKSKQAVYQLRTKALCKACVLKNNGEE